MTTEKAAKPAHPRHAACGPAASKPSNKFTYQILKHNQISQKKCSSDHIDQKRFTVRQQNHALSYTHQQPVLQTCNQLFKWIIMRWYQTKDTEAEVNTTNLLLTCFLQWHIQLIQYLWYHVLPLPAGEFISKLRYII
jgi:hypothetical protein